MGQQARTPPSVTESQSVRGHILAVSVSSEVQGKTPRWVGELQDWSVGESRRAVSAGNGVPTPYSPTPTWVPGTTSDPILLHPRLHPWALPIFQSDRKIVQNKNVHGHNAVLLGALQRPSFCQNLPRGSNTSQMEGSRLGLGGRGCPSLWGSVQAIS